MTSDEKQPITDVLQTTIRAFPTLFIFCLADCRESRRARPFSKFSRRHYTCEDFSNTRNKALFSSTQPKGYI